MYPATVYSAIYLYDKDEAYKSMYINQCLSTDDADEPSLICTISFQ